MRISCRAGRRGRGQPVSIVSGPDSRSGGYVSGPLMSRDTRAVRASGLDHDITDTPTVDRHEQTRVERSTIEAVQKFDGLGFVSVLERAPGSLGTGGLILFYVRIIFLSFFFLFRLF